MTQELIDLRASILEGRYNDALTIVDELDGMSKKDILRKIKSYLKILLIHLIKNQVEQRLTGSWVNSIRNSIREIKELNLKDNKTSYYINSDEWENLIEEEVIEDAIADASEEVLGGKLTDSEVGERLNKSLLMQTAIQLLELTYNYSPKYLPARIKEQLIQLPGGEDWSNRKSP